MKLLPLLLVSTFITFSLQAGAMDSLIEKATEHLQAGKALSMQAAPLLAAQFEKLSKEKKESDAKVDLNDAKAVRAQLSQMNPEIGRLLAEADVEFSEAEKYLQQAIKLDREYVVAWHLYAACLIGQAKQKEGSDAANQAIKLYDAGLALNPKETGCYLGKFAMYMLLQDVEAARQTIVTGLKQNPDDPKLVGLKAPLKIE